ncbi:MAG: hypothetical protein KG028_05520 [Actinobacteria bacterium]|nr:hypothetical protein [Actinomycetota bacterium]
MTVTNRALKWIAVHFAGWAVAFFVPDAPPWPIPRRFGELPLAVRAVIVVAVVLNILFLVGGANA